MLIHNKDDIEFVTEFPCFLGHPVGKRWYFQIINQIKVYMLPLGIELGPLQMEDELELSSFI